jgi:signal transduction histidine kinase
VRSQETQDIPGTGLGLVICKKIISELGGLIQVESKSGEGTTLLVRFPVAEKKAANAAKVQQ